MSYVHCNYTYEDLLFMKERSDPTAVHCSTVQGKIEFLPLSAALQNMLTYVLCHCKYTYEESLLIRCTAAQQQCIAALFKAKCMPNSSVQKVCGVQLHL